MVPKTFVEEVYRVSDSSMGTATMLSQTGLFLWSATVRGPYLTVHNSHIDSFRFSHNQKQPALLETKSDILYATTLLGTKLDALYATALLGAKLEALYATALLGTKLDALYATTLLGTKLNALYATALLGTKLDALFINNLVVFVL